MPAARAHVPSVICYYYHRRRRTTRILLLLLGSLFFSPASRSTIISVADDGACAKRSRGPVFLCPAAGAAWWRAHAHDKFDRVNN